MAPKPWGLATAVGSLPFTDPEKAVDFVLEHLPQVPHWPQLPQRDSREGMVPQYTAPLRAGGLLIEREGSFRFAEDEEDWVDRLTAFYEKSLLLSEAPAGNLEGFALPRESAPGFYAFRKRMAGISTKEALFLKGQVTGPVTMGLQLTGRGGRPAFYDDQLKGLLLEALALQALWQVREYKKLGFRAIIFFDDPGLCSYGQSATVGLSGGAITEAYAFLADRLREEGALVGVHACAGVEWTLALKAGLDIINADTFHYFPALLASARELTGFLEEGGTLAWGMVPTRGGEGLGAADLWSLFRENCGKLAARGVPPEFLKRQWLLTPACGTGSLTEEEAAFAYQLLKAMAVNPSL